MLSENSARDDGGAAVRAFINGRIYLSFNPARAVEAMVVASGRVLYAGSSEKARRIAEELGGEIVDLNEKTVLPGFIDSHLHLEELGMALETSTLEG